MEPIATAWLLLTTAALLVLAAWATRLSGRFGVPSLLFFLALGFAMRVQPFVPLPAPDYGTAFRFGVAALVLILFDGGLNTPARAARSVVAPASLLATAGVLVTALIVAAVARALGMPWPLALLTGAVVSSTDAAAVFSVLRASHSRLRERVGLTLELESGLNDPMAVFLTVAATEAIVGDEKLGWTTALHLVQQLALGFVAGAAVGWIARRLLLRSHLPATGLYPVLTSAVAFGTFALATLVDGSGFLAVYVAAIYLGSGRIPYRASVLRVHDALAWISQIGMFLALGLSVEPRALVSQLWPGLLLALALAVVARPVAVLASLVPFRFAWKERVFIAITGLRGAVPIVLATYPLIRGVPGAVSMFDLVFVMVAVNSVFPGAAASWLSRRLHMRQQRPPPPPAGLEMVSAADYDGEFVSYFVSEASAVADAKVKDIPLPETCLVTLIVRDHEVLAPRGETEIKVGDHVYVFTKAADRPFADLLFGYAEE